jgi:hypothetical protein
LFLIDIYKNQNRVDQINALHYINFYETFSINSIFQVFDLVTTSLMDFAGEINSLK